MPPKDRLLPSLLDRLTDGDPGIRRPESDRFTFDLPEYRAAVFRDLDWLMNAVSPARAEDIEGLEHVSRSTLNYGMPPLSGGVASGLDARQLERRMREVIQRFEPRIIADTVKVQVEVEAGTMSHRALTFRVEGLLWAQPVPEQIYLRTKLDLETGHVTLADFGVRGVGLMDPRLLRYYERELQFVREMGAEYAQEYPKIAARLGLAGLECTDPYVERLLEGFAFLAARVQLKLDAEFPRLTQNVLETVCPQYLAPTPSMAVVQLQPKSTEGSLASGFPVKRDTALKSPRGKGGEASCEYRTAHHVTLWPVEITQASFAPYSRELGGEDAPGSKPVRSAVRLRLRAQAGLTFDRLPMDSLVLYLRGVGDAGARLYEQIVAGAAGILVRSTQNPSLRERLEPSCVRRVGFDDDQALLPYGRRSFRGYRLLHEYFALPERFHFVELGGLARALARFKEAEIEIAILLQRDDPSLHNVVDASNFALHCTPAINVFPMQGETIHLSDRQYEYHVVPDRTQPMDYEVYDVVEVEGSGSSERGTQPFAPLYAAPDVRGRHPGLAFFTTHRMPRVTAESQRRKGTRSTYVGTEVFLSIVDGSEAPWDPELRQLAVKLRCTNRDLPIHLVLGQGATDFTLVAAAPVAAVRCVAGPTAPSASFVVDPDDPTRAGEIGWRLINHLSLNYLSLTDSADGRGAEALRELLSLYAPVASATIRKQIDGVRSVSSRAVVRRIKGSGPLAFGRGIEIALTLDESAFAGSGAFLLGAVLDEFFARYVSINSFTETTVSTLERGELIRWPAKSGQRQVV